MKNLLKGIKKDWMYAGFDRPFYAANRHVIDQINFNPVYKASLLGTVLTGVMLCFSLFIEPIARLSGVYLFFTLMYGGLALFLKQYVKDNKVYTNVGVYLLIAISLGFGIFIGIFTNTHQPAVTYFILFIAMPMLFLMEPFKMDAILLVWSVLFCVSSFLTKEINVAEIDVLNCIGGFAVASFAGLFTTRVRLQEIQSRVRLEKMCNTDELTALPNRRKFNLIISEMFDYSIANQCDLTIMLFDIDNFKQYNDSFGHLAGDSCLERVGGVLTHFSLKDDLFIARYGGEEFVVVDGSKDQDVLLKIALEMVKVIEGLNIDNPSSPSKKITISLGMVSRITSGAKTYMELINKADETMYRAKMEGKNRVVVG